MSFAELKDKGEGRQTKEGRKLESGLGAKAKTHNYPVPLGIFFNCQFLVGQNSEWNNDCGAVQINVDDEWIPDCLRQAPTGAHCKGPRSFLASSTWMAGSLLKWAGCSGRQ